MMAEDSNIPMCELSIDSSFSAYDESQMSKGGDVTHSGHVGLNKAEK